MAAPVFRNARARTNPYRLYLATETAMSLLGALAYTDATLYRVVSGHYDPLQLVLLGTVLELSYFVFQVPTGVLADVVSRRLCIVAGVSAIAIGLVIQGLSAAFAPQLVAQVLVGLGAALMYGAQEAWVAGELGERDMTGVYVRATRLGLLGSVVGSLLSAAGAVLGLGVPMLAAGAATAALALVLACVMPERGFERAADGYVGGLRAALTAAAGHARATRRAVLAVPGLVLVLAAMFFTGAWSESFDRLWGAFLVEDVAFPKVHALTPALWFSAIAAVVALLSYTTTGAAGRRAERLGPDSLAGTLLGVTVLMAAGTALLAATHRFPAAIAAYLLVAVLRPVTEPLLSAWMVGRLEPGVRATALSAKDLFDSGGQIIGGPVVGQIGVVSGLRIALAAGTAALAPACALLLAADRRIRTLASSSVAAPAQSKAADTAGG